jgi:hypothetical protein
MGKCYVWLVAILLVLSAVGAWAYPNFDGASGIVTLPNTEVAPVGTVNLAVGYQTMYENGVDLKIWPVRINAGVIDKLELSAAYTIFDIKDNVIPLDHQWTVGTKYAIMQEPVDKIGLAIGGSYGKIDAGDAGDVALTRAYLALSKDFDVVKDPENPVKGKFTAGWAYMKFGHPDDVTVSKPYAALEFTGATGATLGLEYRWKDSEADRDAVFSAAARVPVTPDKAWWVEIGTTNSLYGATATFDNQKVFYGIGYRFAGK